jgi:hypothetical protein
LEFLDQRSAGVCAPGPGQPGLPTQLVAGLFILKHMHDLSDEVLCAHWLENPYYRFFCGELSFCHRLPFDRSSLTHWRQRLGEEQLVAPIQESLSVAHKTGALATGDLERVAIDTTCSPRQSRSRPTRGCAIERWRNWSISRGATSAVTTELPAPGQARRYHGRALHACAPVPAGPPRARVFCAFGSAA